MLGNNEGAVAAAAEAARQRAFDTIVVPTQPSTMQAESAGRALAESLCTAQRQADRSGIPVCLVSGGEPVVTLVDSKHRGRGGRNQHLALAALHELLSHNLTDAALERLTIVSAGTDGEDGPTDAAGAIVDDAVISAMRKEQLDPADYLARNDSYHFFAATHGLWKTGPTHTNVCDLRVLIAWPGDHAR